MTRASSQSVTAAYRLYYRSYNTNLKVDDGATSTESHAPLHNDDPLQHLDITSWSEVPISSYCASRAISLYLKTDHPLLGMFDPDLFLNDLVRQQTRLCSRLLVSAILFLGCVSSPEQKGVSSSRVIDSDLD